MTGLLNPNSSEGQVHIFVAIFTFLYLLVGHEQSVRQVPVSAPSEISHWIEG